MIRRSRHFLIGLLLGSLGLAAVDAQVRYFPSGSRITNGVFLGQSKFADGTAAAPSITFSSQPDSGLALSSALVAFSSDGTFVMRLAGTDSSVGGVKILNGIGLASDIGAATDLFLLRDAPNVLAQRNGTVAQTLSVYNTFTDASNYERLSIAFSGGNPIISTARAGTGSERTLILRGQALQLVTAEGTHIWNLTSAGHLLPATDNTYDIGASGATRPRTGHFGTSLIVGSGVTVTNTLVTTPAAGLFNWSGRSALESPADGVIKLRNAGDSDFTMLQFGGTTSSFPALKRDAAGLHARTADDGGFTYLAAKWMPSDYGSDGAISIAPQVVHVTKGSAAALTIADPSAAQEGTLMIITAETAFAHTVSNAAGSGFNAGGAGSDVATFGGAIGDSMVIVAINGKWNVMSLRNVTLG